MGLDGPDQPRATFTGERKDGQEVGFVQVNVQLAINWRTGSLYIGDIEDLTVSAAWKSCAHCLTHHRASAVTASYIVRLASFLFARWSPEPGDNAVALVAVACKFRPTLNRDAHRLQASDQQPLMLVLGKDMEKRIRRDVSTDVLK